MDYPMIRASLDPRMQYIPSEDLEQFVVENLGAYPEDVEDFLGSLGSFGKAAGPVLQRALPGVVQGAATGASFGPWGALIGALGGGVASALSPSPATSPAAPIVPAAVRTAAATAPQVPASSPAAAPAASLVGLLGRPEVIQALGALTMGSGGRSSVQVGSTQVPVAAIANLLSVLATQAAASAPSGARAGEDVEQIPDYLKRSDGTMRVLDPSSAQDRAEALLGLFEATPAFPFSAWPDDVEELEAMDESASFYESVLGEGAW